MSGSKVKRKVIPQKAKGQTNLPFKKVLSWCRHGLKLLLYLCLIVATLAAFWPVRNAESIGLDDDEVLQKTRR